MVRQWFLPAALVAAVIACGGDDSTSPGNQPGDGSDGPGNPPSSVVSGSLRFSYTGDRSGSFTAEGKMPTSGAAPTGSYAAAHRDTDLAQMGVVAVQTTSGPRMNQALLLFEGTGTGSYGLGSGCTDQCAVMYIYFDIAQGTGMTTDTRIFFAKSGTVNVTEASSKTLKGTFTGTAESFPAGDETIEIKNGTFTAPVLLTSIPQGPNPVGAGQ